MKTFFVLTQTSGKKAKKTILNLFLISIFLIGCTGQTVNNNIQPSGQTEVDNTPEAQISNLAQIQERGFMVVGTAVTKPFEFYDTDTNKLIGFDIDLIKTIARQLDVKVEFVEMSFANLIPALQDGMVDMTIAAMYITAERKDKVDFSEPYLRTGLVMVVQPGLHDQVKRVEDLSGLIVGVKIGSTGAKLAQDLIARGIDLKVTEYKDTLNSIMDLEVDRVDVIFNDYLNTLAYIKNSESEIKIVVDDQNEVIFLSKVGLGIAVNQKNKELLDAVNAAMLQTKQTGVFQTIYKIWLLPNGT